MSEKFLFCGIFGLMGVLFAGIGAAFFWGGITASAEADRVAALTPVPFEQLADLPPNTEIIIEGRISERNTGLIDGLVTFTEHEYQGVDCDDDGSCDQVWTETQRATPALWLDMPGGRLRLSNTDYQLYNPPISWQTTPELIEGRTLEYAGFRMGNPAFAAGNLSTDDGITLNAEFLFGGSRAEYIDYQEEDAFGLFMFGAIFGGVGLLLLAVGIILAVTM